MHLLIVLNTIPPSLAVQNEPVYTYKSTSRNGTLSWKIVVDHPSVLNLIVDKVLSNEIDSNADKVLESFFAGCQTYDLYDFNYSPFGVFIFSNFGGGSAYS